MIGSSTTYDCENDLRRSSLSLRSTVARLYGLFDALRVRHRVGSKPEPVKLHLSSVSTDSPGSPTPPHQPALPPPPASRQSGTPRVVAGAPCMEGDAYHSAPCSPPVPRLSDQMSASVATMAAKLGRAATSGRMHCSMSFVSFVSLAAMLALRIGPVPSGPLSAPARMPCTQRHALRCAR